MASNETESTKVCLVCFETRPLKIIGRCKHSFCSECLSTTLESCDGGVFSCPACKVDYPRPLGGVKGFADFTGEKVAAKDLGTEFRGKGKKTPARDVKAMMDVKCMICHHKKKEVQAINLCVECKNLYLCEACTEIHAKNKVTQGHVVIRLRQEVAQQEAICEKHDSALDSYCRECGHAVCVVCVLLEHGDHTLDKLSELVDTEVEALKVILTEREERMKKLQELQVELALLTRVAPVVDKHDVLIKEIEDQAQKCIEQIVKQKDDLKGKVKADYKVIHDIPECLKKVSEMLQTMQEPIQRAGRLLALVEHKPMYIDSLKALQQDLKALAETGTTEAEGMEYAEQLKKLHQLNFCFNPVALNSFGTLNNISTCKGKFDFEPKEIFKITMQGSKDKFIPCVAILGQVFAVAHATKDGGASNAIDIYEFPGTLKRTFKDHVPPLYDMSATPDGRIAVLSDGRRGSSSSVKLFDSETGYISSTRDIDVAKSFSIGVTLQHQYVILGDNQQGEKQITVADKEGTVVRTHVIKEAVGEKGFKPRITCGGRFIFVIEGKRVLAYEVKDKWIRSIGSCFTYREPEETEGVDISANVWDDIFYSCTFKNNVHLVKWVFEKENNIGWAKAKEHILTRAVRGADKETTISVRDCHILVSNGKTIRVYRV